MSLKSLKQIRHTVGFRLTLWYAALFLLSHLVLFSLTYVLLAASLRQKDHDSIRATLHDLAGQYHAAGLEGLKKELALQAKLQKTTPFFIRFAAPSNTTLFGYPSKPVDKAREAIASVGLLPKLFERVRALEAKVKELEK